MTKKKLTNKIALEIAIASLEQTNISKDYSTDEITEKLKGMIAQLEKKSGSERKPTATQVANEGYKALILDFLTSEKMTVSDIIKAIPEFDGFTPQKVAPLVKSLLDAGFVEKKVEKGRSYFCKAGE